ncbi:MAG: DUF2344 domain-containing protein, partial [Deltaproteobacteria bacterium]|nr:DUF2344 domain-containing protein [Deltaproteobacteria bacterium]
IDLDSILRRQEFFKKNIRHRNLNLRWHDGRMSILEGLISRGDERISTLIERAFSMGSRFDGWGDQFKFDLWDKAMQNLQIDREEYLCERSIGEDLPWGRIDCGMSNNFLVREYEKSLTGEHTEDCRFGKCHDCGVCGKGVEVILATDTDAGKEQNHQGNTEDQKSGSTRKLRVRFAKMGNTRFLSHLETASALVKGITIGGLYFVFSKGFHPSPKISFSNATPVGIESNLEYVDIQIMDPSLPLDNFIGAINNSLPSGMEILHIDDVPSDGGTLSEYIQEYKYIIRLPLKVTEKEERDFTGKIDHFLALSAFDVPRIRKGQETKRDIRPFVESLSLDIHNSVVSMNLSCGAQGATNPLEIMKHVMGMSDRAAKMARVRKTGVLFSDGSFLPERK